MSPNLTEDVSRREVREDEETSPQTCRAEKGGAHFDLIQVAQGISDIQRPVLCGSTHSGAMSMSRADGVSPEWLWGVVYLRSTSVWGLACLVASEYSRELCPVLSSCKRDSVTCTSSR